MSNHVLFVYISLSLYLSITELIKDRAMRSVQSTDKHLVLIYDQSSGLYMKNQVAVYNVHILPFPSRFIHYILTWILWTFKQAIKSVVFLKRFLHVVTNEVVEWLFGVTAWGLFVMVMLMWAMLNSPLIFVFWRQKILSWRSLWMTTPPSSPSRLLASHVTSPC